MTTEPTPTAPRASRRLLWTVVLLMVVAAAALWGSSALVWVSQQFQTPFTGVRTSGVPGADLRPELVPLALAALAAIAAVLATGGWLRRVVGVLVALAGALLGWRVSTWYGSNDFGIALHGDVPAGSKPIGAFTENPVGPVLMAVGALLLVLSGVLVAARARRMPAMGAKYSAPGTAQQRVSQDPDKRLWEALDSGEDPTDSDDDASGRGGTR
jgi:uncharacterized membrane protein (TIGR02234 family)